MSLEIIKKYSIKAKKSLGQNFLVNDEIIENIANIFDIKGKNIIEVGPGYGALTDKLIKQKPKSIELIELDQDMVYILKTRKDSGDFDLTGIEFHINNIDVLEYEPINKSHGLNRYKPFSNQKDNFKYFVIANIPYYITSPILRHFLYKVENKPEKMLILMQKDVGDKILSAKSGVLSLFITKKCFVKEELFVAKENFIPIPKVESCVLSFQLHHLYDDIDDEKFLKLIKIGFSSPRKKLTKNFINAGYEKKYIKNILKELSIEESIRSEDLNIAQWCSFIGKFNI